VKEAAGAKIALRLEFIVAFMIKIKMGFSFLIVGSFF
jgi:hypothetical protein